MQSTEAEGFHSFLDSFLTPSLLWRVMRRWTSATRMARIPGIETAFIPAGSKLSLWPIMRDDWVKTTPVTLVAMDNMLWLELFNAAMAQLPRQGTGVFLLENQAWERAFIRC